MRRFDSQWLMPGVVKEMRRRAMAGFFYGTNSPSDRAYVNNCTATHEPSGTIIIFTRDTGHHACGWWKNPDYDNCFHLSLSFRDPETGAYDSRNLKLTGEWLNYFYGDHKSLIWVEPPYSEQGKQSDTYHYRLFVHPDWKTPLLPRGEVYSREFTEAGWKSWSDVQVDIQQAQQQITDRILNG